MFDEKGWLDEWLSDPENEEPEIPKEIADHVDQDFADEVVQE